MKIIDAHIHFSNIESFKKVSEKSKVDYSLTGFNKEFEDVIAVGMGVTETKDVFPSKDTSNPMPLDLDVNPDNLFVCLGFNPKEPFKFATLFTTTFSSQSKKAIPADLLFNVVLFCIKFSELRLF